MTKIDHANQLVTQAFEIVYQDAKEKAPKLKNPKYGWFNKTNAATYLGVSIPTLNAWFKKYNIPYTSIDGIVRFAKKDLDNFMEGHKKKWVG
ncbi:helix-turn-helix domain-containing protein [Lactobacillus hominis]|uniref:helix-turn-helix domain-containing protein n=1 Tax=Lactobacillus hominis TaxID=1203033 RepID=UPI0023F2CC56|nr:helix-turn-helix domain-containing protein [Lactobacillus hominis]